MRETINFTSDSKMIKVASCVTIWQMHLTTLLNQTSTWIIKMACYNRGSVVIIQLHWLRAPCMNRSGHPRLHLWWLTNNKRIWRGIAESFWKSASWKMMLFPCVYRSFSTQTTSYHCNTFLQCNSFSTITLQVANLFSSSLFILHHHVSSFSPTPVNLLVILIVSGRDVAIET